MAEKLKLEMVTPYKRVLSEEVDEVTAPGTVGEFGVLPDHTSLLTTLKVGEVEDNVMTVLVETAEPADQIDLERAKAALSRAEEALKKLSSEDKDFKIMEAALERAMIRVQVAGKKLH